MAWVIQNIIGVYATTANAFVWTNVAPLWRRLALPNQSMFEIAVNAYYAGRRVQIWFDAGSNSITGIASA